MKVLVVLTSHDRLGDTGRATGFWLEELAAPLLPLQGGRVGDHPRFPPEGRQPPLDPKSNEPDAQTDQTRRFEADTEAMTALANTVRLESVNADDYDTVFYPPGGHGPCGTSPRTPTPPV